MRICWGLWAQLQYPGLLLAVLGTMLALSSPVQAQTLYGSIVGRVTDQTGAAIPGADVTVINEQTNRTRTGITNDVGLYSFPTVQTGTFTVRVSMPGFKEFVKTKVPVTVNNTTRVNVVLEIGEVTETLTVTSETAILQTDRAEVRAEITEERLENLPVPLGRNYQDLFKTLPGFGPPRAVHSIQTNPSRSRAFNVNGVSDSINTTRIDGITSTNPWLPHITGYVPSLEAIETVNVVTNSFDAEQGLAGGAAITVQLKSGTNDFHGSAFFLHHDNALRAKRFIYPYPEGLEKGKFIFNQWGATLGGPIKKDKLFFFTSYEGTANSRFASRTGSVPTLAVRNGDLSNLGRDIYDPLTGNPDGTGRVQFPNNVIPENRIDPIAKQILAKVPLPNVAGRENQESNNYFGSGGFTWDKWTFDTKVDFNATDNLNMFGRLSTLTYDVEQPTLFGNDNLLGRALSSFGLGGGNPGFGTGTTWNVGYGVNYIVSPNFVIDGNVGWAKFFTDSRNPFLDQKIGSDVLGIPGTNGPEWWQGGWPYFDLEGYDDYGTVDSFMPYVRDDRNLQYTLNFNWTKGTHEVRWGLDLSRQDMNHTQPEGGVGQGARGRFRFRRGLTRLCLEPDGQGGCDRLTSTTSRQSIAAFLLGMPHRVGKNFLTVFPYTTRNWLRGFYIRDRWQVTPKFTLSYGTRWEHFPIPTRCCGRGFERYDPVTNQMLVGGVGQVPRDLGVSVSKTMFAPRLGLAYRITDTFVFRAGYGLTNDPYPLARDLRTNYPVFIENDVVAPFSWQHVTTLSEGIPPILVPDLGNGIIDIPGDVFAHTIPSDKFRRGYVQSWNVTLQKQLVWDLVGEVGYVATRSIRQLGRRELNWAPLGAGSQGRQLVQAFNRTANTRLTDPAGHSFYDSMQARPQRRFADGFSLDVSYVWSKSISTAFGGDDSDSTLKINIPELFHLNKQVSDIDRTHNFQLSNIWELPFGPGRRFASDSGFLSHLVGGWQVNNIVSWYSGTPFDPQGNGSANAPGSTQRADLVGPIKKLGGKGPGTPFYDPSAFAVPATGTIGTAGFGILRSPRTFNWDFGVFRHFRLTEGINLEFRMEAFNFTNHPQFGPDNDAFASDDVDDPDFLEIDEGINERVIRFGLKLRF